MLSFKFEVLTLVLKVTQFYFVVDACTQINHGLIDDVGSLVVLMMQTRLHQ